LILAFNSRWPLLYSQAMFNTFLKTNESALNCMFANKKGEGLKRGDDHLSLTVNKLAHFNRLCGGRVTWSFYKYVDKNEPILLSYVFMLGTKMVIHVISFITFTPLPLFLFKVDAHKNIHMYMYMYMYMCI